MKLALAIILLAPLASAAVMAPPELATGVFGVPLHSRPGVFNKAYLDFTSYPSTATASQIEAIWQIVAQAYLPFNVDVTTEFPGPQPNVAWCVIGGPLIGTTAGEAGIGNWTVGTQYAAFGTAFSCKVYGDGLNNDPVAVAFAIIHEDGHDFGLQHQLTGYMVASIDPSQSFWSTGINVIGAYQDDAAVIAGQTGYAGPAPEPPVLLAVAGYLLVRRTRVTI